MIESRCASSSGCSRSSASSQPSFVRGRVDQRRDERARADRAAAHRTPAGRTDRSDARDARTSSTRSTRQFKQARAGVRAAGSDGSCSMSTDGDSARRPPALAGRRRATSDGCSHDVRHVRSAYRHLEVVNGSSTFGNETGSGSRVSRSCRADESELAELPRRSRLANEQDEIHPRTGARSAKKQVRRRRRRVEVGIEPALRAGTCGRSVRADRRAAAAGNSARSRRFVASTPLAMKRLRHRRKESPGLEDARLEVLEPPDRLRRRRDRPADANFVDRLRERVGPRAHEHSVRVSRSVPDPVNVNIQCGTCCSSV